MSSTYKRNILQLHFNGLLRINAYLTIVLTLFVHLFFLPLNASAQEKTDNEVILEIAPKLLDKNTRDGALEQLITTNATMSREWLTALLDGVLYLRKSDSLPVIVEKQGKRFKMVNASNGNDEGEAGRREVSKIKINNAIRGKLRAAIASISLKDEDPEVRLQAVKTMTRSLNESDLAAISAYLPEENNKRVQQAMQLALNLADLSGTDDQKKIDAVHAIGINTDDTVTQKLRELTSQSEAPEVANAASESLIAIEKRISLYEKIETLFFGLSLGSVLAMAAIGLAITFGVMGVINMAHGEMIMLGAYTTWAIQTVIPAFIEYSLFIAVPAAFLVAFLVGMLIEILVIRHLYGRPLETLLATFGISLILQQTVRTLISPQNVPVSNPAWMSGLLEIDPALSLAINRVIIFFFCLFIFFTLMWLLKYTNFGLKVRAVSQNRQMARALGAKSGSIDALTFGLGAGIAGVAGVALTQLSNVGPNMGQAYIVDSFMVVVFGGVGNLWGTLLAGLSLGVFNKLLEPWAGAVLAKIVVLVFIIMFIQKYPKGLFPQKGRAAGD